MTLSLDKVNTNLEYYHPVDNQGNLTEEAGQFAGQFVFDANKNIIAHLAETGALLKQENITHSYPHDWRSKKTYYL